MRPSPRALVVLALVALLLWPGPGPVSLAYATSDSMAPTIAPGDGYVLVSFGGVEEGDIVTFWSPTREEYVTHRIVDETEAGYVTQGDANPSTDQDAGYEPVTPDRIRGKALTIGGNPIVIPELGRLVSTMAGLGPIPIALALLLAGLAAFRSTRERERDVLTAGDVLLPLFAVALLAGVSMPAMAGASTHPVSFQAVDGQPDGPTEVRVGESAVRPLTFEVTKPPLTTYVVEGDGLTVTDRTVDGGAMELLVRVPPTEAPGTVDAEVSIHAYPSLLPPRVIESLHRVHPLVALGATNLVVYLPIAMLAGLLVRTDTPIRPSKRRSPSRGELP